VLILHRRLGPLSSRSDGLSAGPVRVHLDLTFGHTSGTASIGELCQIPQPYCSVGLSLLFMTCDPPSPYLILLITILAIIVSSSPLPLLPWCFRQCRLQSARTWYRFEKTATVSSFSPAASPENDLDGWPNRAGRDTSPLPKPVLVRNEHARPCGPDVSGTALEGGDGRGRALRPSDDTRKIAALMKTIRSSKAWAAPFSISSCYYTRGGPLIK